jgi:acyl carrier protein
LPLTPNGKINRPALPAPNSSNTLQDRAASQPSSAVEERLARILGKLLGMDSVAVDDNFFNLGGHSLLATQLIARIRDAFGVDLSLRTIFDTPTIAELAPQIEESVLKKISAMSEEDAQQLLNSIMPPGTESASL